MIPGGVPAVLLLLMIPLAIALLLVAVRFLESLFRVIVHRDSSQLRSVAWTGAIVCAVGLVIAVPRFERSTLRRSLDSVVEISDSDFARYDLKTGSCDVATAQALPFDQSAVDRWHALVADAVNFERSGWQVTRYGRAEAIGVPYPFYRSEWFEARLDGVIVRARAALSYELSVFKGSCSHLGIASHFVELDEFGELPRDTASDD